MTNIQTCCGLRHSSSMERKLILKFIHRRAGDAWKPATLLHLTILMPSLFNTFHEDSAKFHPSVSRWYLENPVPFFIWRSWRPVCSLLFMNLDTSFVQLVDTAFATEWIPHWPIRRILESFTFKSGFHNLHWFLSRFMTCGDQSEQNIPVLDDMNDS